MFFKANSYSDYCIEVFSDAQAFIQYLKANAAQTDIIITDIKLNKNYDGVDIAGRFSRTYPQIRNIFITGLLEKAVNINNAPHTFFLVKPVDYTKIAEALEKAINSRADDYSQTLTLSLGSTIERVRQNTIVFLDSYGRQIELHFSDGRKARYYKKIGDIQKELPYNFYRAHKSFIVNFDYVKRLDKSGFLINEDLIIPIPHHKYNEAKAAYTDYLVCSTKKDEESNKK